MMIHTRSSHSHRSLMFKILIVSALLYTFWGPAQPIRSVTADALSITADLLRR